MYRAQLGVLVEGGDNLFAEIAHMDFCCCSENQLEDIRRTSGWDIEPNTLYKVSDVYLFIDHAVNNVAKNAREVTTHLMMNDLLEQIHMNTGIYSYSYNCIPADLLYVRWIVDQEPTPML